MFAAIQRICCADETFDRRATRTANDSPGWGTGKIASAKHSLLLIPD
jgi:hypothetical protein